MRTTVNLDDRLLRAARRLAAARGISLSAVIEDALRTKLSAGPARARPPFELVTFGGDGPHAGIDLDRTNELLAIEDVERYGGR